MYLVLEVFSNPSRTACRMQAVREGLLSRAANQAGSMFEISVKFYVGTFYSFYAAWLSGNKTMSDSGQ